MNQLLDKLKESNRLERTACQANFAKIVLRSSDHHLAPFELSLFVDQRWWNDLNGEALSASDEVFISLNQYNLRVRNAPTKGSFLQLFDKTLKIDHRADQLDVSINAKVKIDKTLYWPKESEPSGFEATLASGSIVIKNLPQTFQGEDLGWIRESTGLAGAELLLGASHVQFKLMEEVSQVTKPVLYEYIGTTHKNGLPEYLWKFSSCEYEPHLATPDEVLGDKQQKIIEFAQTIYGGQSIEVTPYSGEDQGVFYLMSQENPKTYLKPGLEIKVFQEQHDGSSNLALSWKPKALKVENGVYKLLDQDEIDLLLDPHAEPLKTITPQFKVEWNKQNERKLHFSKPPGSKAHLYLAQATDKECVHGKSLWTFAKVDTSQEEYSWMQYQLSDFSGSGSIDLSLPILSNPTENLKGHTLKFYEFDREVDSSISSNPWQILIDVGEALTEAQPSRLSMSFSAQKIELEIRKPAIAAKSPSMPFYTKELKDPTSLPSNSHWKEHLGEASLLFVNESNPANLALAAGSVGFVLDQNREPTFLPNPHQVSFYQTAHLAVIDRVSPSSLNLPSWTDPGVRAVARAGESTAHFEVDAETKIVKIRLADIEPNGKEVELWLDLKSGSGEDRPTFLAPISDVDQESNQFIVKLSQIKKNNLVDLTQSEQSVTLSYYAIRLPKIVSPRDPGHGFIRSDLKKFTLEFNESDTILKISEKYDGKQSSTEALMPWVERTFSGARSPATDTYQLFHRNLVLEHGEFELAREYADGNATKTSYHASEAFVQATRDRYCLAADLTGDDRSLKNWLPGTAFVDESEAGTTPTLEYSSQTGEMPEVSISWSRGLEEQKLGIRKDQAEDKNWLEYYIQADLSQALPKIKLKDIPAVVEPAATPKPPGSYKQAINSYSPLLFNSNRYIDNLGVVRSLLRQGISENWNIEEFSVPGESSGRDNYYSVSTTNHLLYEASHDGQHSTQENLSQVLVTFDGFKVKSDGTIPTLQQSHFHNKAFNLGAFSFFSNVSSDEGSPLEKVNYWPRYRGVPFYVIEIDSCKIGEVTVGDVSWVQPKEIKFSAVIANPEELARYHPDDETPNFVFHALRKNQVVYFKYTWHSTNPTITIERSSKFDWMFSVSKQLSDALDANALPGRLARLNGTVSNQGASNVKLQVDHSDSKALALGKLWSLKEQELELKGHALFFRKSESIQRGAQAYIQSQFEFFTPTLTKNWIEKPFTLRIDQERNAFILEGSSDALGCIFCQVTLESTPTLFRIKKIEKLQDGTYLISDTPLSGITGPTVSANLLFYEVDGWGSSGTLSPIYSGQAQCVNGRVKLLNLAHADMNHMQGFVFRKTGEPERIYRVVQHDVEESDPKEHYLTLDSSWNCTEADPIDVEVLETPFIRVGMREAPLHFHLPIELQPNASVHAPKIEALISSSSRLILYLREATERTKQFIPKLIQSHFYCLTVNDLYSQTNEGSLALWIENDFGAETSSYYLAGLWIKNLKEDDPILRITLEGHSSPMRLCLASGFHLIYFGKDDEYRHHTWMSAIFKYDRFIVRFEDQDFSKIHQLSSTCDNTVEKTGFLQLFNSEESMNEREGPLVQGPIVGTFKRDVRGEVLFSVEQSYFARNPFLAIGANLDNVKPDISYASNVPQAATSCPASSNYYLQEIRLDYSEQTYLSLETKSGDFVLKEMDLADIPINFCLEPNATSNTTKLSPTKPQLAHRLLLGRLIRSDLENRLYKRGDLKAKQDAREESVPIFRDKSVLSPIAIDENNRLVLMQDYAFLLPCEGNLQLKTENILILNRPHSQTKSPLFSLAQQTATLQNESQTHPIFDQPMIRKKILEKGANGLAVKRIMNTRGVASYSFVPSPFHDVEGTEHITDQQLAQMLDANGFTSFKKEKDSPRSKVLDSRSISPKDSLRIQEIDAQNSYQVTDTDPIENQCCQVERQIRYRFGGAMNTNYKGFQPSLYLYETPAYKKMDSLWYLPPKQQEESDRNRKRRGPISAYFLPYQMQVDCGPDKPGAVFHHLLRNVTHKLGDQRGETSCRIGESVDFLIREAQQIKVAGCISAAIENLCFKPFNRDPALSTITLKPKWDDVFGRITLNNLTDVFMSSRPEGTEEDILDPYLRPVDEELFAFEIVEKLKPPLKLICQHNYDVFEIQKQNAAIPAYTDEKSEISWWPRLHLASKISNLKLDQNVEFEIEGTTQTPAKQRISLDFEPYLSIASFKIKPQEGGADFIRVKLPEGAQIEWLTALLPSLKVHVNGLKFRRGEITGEEHDPLYVSRLEKEGNDLKVYLRDVTELYDHAIFETKELHLLLELFTVLQEAGQVEGRYLWKLNAQMISLSQSPLIKFQIMWLATSARLIDVKVTNDDGEEEVRDLKVLQTGHFKLYTLDKIIKLLMPALTSPKVAGVLHLSYQKTTGEREPDGTYCKTAFFGNSAASEDAYAEIEKVSDDDFNYRLVAKDEESVQMSVPPSASVLKLYLIKYMNRGQVVYDEQSTPEESC